jgi:PPOX class probable F420-dependent enzyme
MAKLTDFMRELLVGRHYATLATQDLDGSVHLTPVWYLFENEAIYVECPSTSRKARNVAARPKASIMIDTREPGTERWVSASGPAELIEGEASRTINSRIVARYLTKAAIEDPRIGPAFAAVDDATIHLKPARWRGFRAADVDGQFFGGILGATPEKWFLPLDR